MTAEADYHPGFAVHLAIDCGVSRHVGAVFFQVREVARDPWSGAGRTGLHLPLATCHLPLMRVTVFGDYHGEGLYSEASARAIRAKAEELPCRGRLDTVRLDPASSARTGVGPAAYGEFERVFGSRVLSRWPVHRVSDGLDQLEVMLDRGGLLIHPRCLALKSALQNYCRKRTGGGEWLDEPADPQHPHEDLIDALRGGVRDRFPEGRIEQPQLRTVHAGGLC